MTRRADRNREFSRWLLSSARAEDFRDQVAALQAWHRRPTATQKATAEEAARWAQAIEQSDRFVFGRTYNRVMAGIETHNEWAVAYENFKRLRAVEIFSQEVQEAA